jgi:hypothetical protein
MNTQTLAKGLYFPLFGKRETMQEAFDYFTQVAQGSDNPAAIMTAVHVLVNTIAKEIEAINE